jgi:hypothetical protein
VLSLVRDVLDSQLLDAHGRPFGKVDGVVLEFRADGPPRVVALETGAANRLARLPRWLTRPFARWVACATTTRIPRSNVVAVARDVRVSVDATRTPSWRDEAWLARVLSRIPGRRVMAEVRLEQLLGRRVLDIRGRPVGRIEEVRAERQDGEWIVRECVLGAAGLLERFAAGALVAGLLGRLALRPERDMVPWDTLDISDPVRPRLKRRREELPPRAA